MGSSPSSVLSIKSISHPLILISFSLVLSACVGQEGSESDGGVNQQSQSPGTVFRTASFDSSEACPQGGIRIEVGIDSNDNDVLDDSEVQQEQELCNGKDGQDGTNGTDGADGQDAADGESGLNALIRLSEAASGSCAFGGTKIETGLDANRNGALEDTEVDATQTKHVCNGADGQDSADSGLTSLVETSVEPSGAQCAEGGIRIDTGVDANSNGQLDNDEKDDPAFVCNIAGAQGAASLVELSAEPSGVGSQCEFGGTRIDSGPDSDNNGSLEAGEIAYTRYVCEQQECNWTDNGDGTWTVNCEGETDIVLLNPEALEYTGRTTCLVSINNPDGSGSPIPMIYSIDDIGDNLKFVTLTILDGERQNSNSRLLTPTSPEYDLSAVTLYFDNLGTATRGRYLALLSEPDNVVEFTYIDSELNTPQNRFTQGFQAFNDESDGSEGLCNRVAVE